MTAGAAPPHPGAPQAIESYLAEIAGALPGAARARADMVAELRGGLLDAMDAYRSAGLTDDTAAEAALREFGHPRQLASAFGPELAASQARRVALTLVATGPLIGLLWAAALASHIGIRQAPPWQWPGAPADSQVAFPLAAAIAITVWTAPFTLATTGRLARWLPRGPRLAPAAAAAAGFGAMAADVTIFALLASQLLTAPGALAPAPTAGDSEQWLAAAHSAESALPAVGGFVTAERHRTASSGVDSRSLSLVVLQVAATTYPRRCGRPSAKRSASSPTGRVPRQAERLQASANLRCDTSGQAPPTRNGL